MRRKKPKGNDRQYYSKENGRDKKTYPGTKKKKKKKCKVPYPLQKYYDRFAHPQKILQKDSKDGVWRFR